MRTFFYRFADGKEIEHENLSLLQLGILEIAHGKCTYNGWADFMGVGFPSRLGVIGGSNTRGDGFKTGWHPGLNMEIKSPSHYQKVLKEKGMVEVGNERQKDAKRMMKSAIDETVIKDLKNMGADIGDEAAERLMAPVAAEDVVKNAKELE